MNCRKNPSWFFKCWPPLALCSVDTVKRSLVKGYIQYKFLLHFCSKNWVKFSCAWLDCYTTSSKKNKGPATLGEVVEEREVHRGQQHLKGSQGASNTWRGRRREGNPSWLETVTWKNYENGNNQPKRVRVRKRGERTHRNPYRPGYTSITRPRGQIPTTRSHDFQDPNNVINFKWRLVVLIQFGSLEQCRQVFFDKSLPEVVHHLLQIFSCPEAGWNLAVNFSW